MLREGRSKPETDMTDNVPNEKRLAFAQEIAAALGQDLPAACREDWRACAEFIDRNKAAVARPPSDKQLAFARKIAEAMAVELPAKVAESSEACSAFIEANKSALPVGGHGGAGGDWPPSEKALDFAKKIAKSLNISLPEAASISRVACSHFIDDNRARLPARSAS